MGPEWQAVYDGTGDYDTMNDCETAGCGPTEENPCIAFDNATDPAQQSSMCNLYFQWAWYGNNPGNFDDTTLEAFANITNNGECCPEEMTPEPPEEEEPLPLPSVVSPDTADLSTDTSGPVTGCAGFDMLDQSFQDTICNQCAAGQPNVHCECCPETGPTSLRERFLKLAGIKKKK